MSAAQNLPTTNVSLETFWELVAANPDKRLEYRDGIVIENMAGGSIRHAAIGMNCGTLLNNALQGDCLVLSSDTYVKLKSGRLYLPDVSVTCTEQSDDNQNVLLSPALVVEVLSPSTATYDQGVKLPDYRKCPSITTILLIWQDERRVEVHERESERFWSVGILEGAEHYQLRHFPIKIDLDVLYRGIRIGA